MSTDLRKLGQKMFYNIGPVVIFAVGVNLKTTSPTSEFYQSVCYSIFDNKLERLIMANRI